MLERLMTDKQVENRYTEAGRIFGDAVSYIYMGECIDFEKYLTTWGKWEAEYAKRGYRTLPIDDFVKYGGYGKPLKDLGTKRGKNEKAIYHAKLYRELYLGKIQPAVNLTELMKPGEPAGDSDEQTESRMQIGTYNLPSTKKTE